jgi:cytochrome oxidase Cu insertion factor (SCO1/SenC/PrrC family)
MREGETTVVDDPNQTFRAYHVAVPRATIRAAMYTRSASAAVFLVDASGVVTSAIMARRNAQPPMVAHLQPVLRRWTS